MFLVATWQNTLYLATLFSSKEERNASRTGISGTMGQHRLVRLIGISLRKPDMILD
jgi:hypothetical protein